MPFDIQTLTIIYAEDDLVFREIALPAVTKAGMDEESVLMADDGSEALEHLESLQDGNPDEAIVMLLDVNMPVMDGNQCAKEVRARHAAGKLKRVPFVVCCSSGVEQVTFGSEGDIFDITMPKPFSDSQVDIVLTKASEWWDRQKGGAAAPSGGGGGGGGGSFDICNMGCILGDAEPICRMALSTPLALLGFDESLMVECDTAEEVVDAIKQMSKDQEGPLMVFLGNTSWGKAVCSCKDLPRRPFIVCTSFDGCEGEAAEAFNARLRRHFQQEDLQEVVNQCQAWWTG